MRPILLLCMLPALGAPAAEQGSWTFEKIARFDRPAEPVAVGMPFPRGVLRDPALLRLSDAGRPLPLQATVTGRWPDGSVRWLFLRTLADLPGNRARQIQWSIADGPAPAAAAGVEVKRLADGGIQVDTGPLSAVIPASGFYPLTAVRLNGRPVWTEGARPPAFSIRSGNAEYSTAEAGPVRLELEEAGPVAAVIRVSGRHGGPQSPFDFSARLTFWQGKPYIAVEYRVLAARGEPEIPVDRWEWSAAPGEKGRVRLRSTQLKQSDSRLAYSFGPENFRFGAIEHAFQSFWGDFWADWIGPQGGLALTLRHAQQNFPKAIEVAPDRIALSLYPAQAEPLRFPLGAAKTHQMLFNFHEPGRSAEELSLRSLQFQIPDVPSIDSAWYGRSRIWDEQVFEGPRSRRFEALIYDVLDNRPVGMGIWNFGDEVDWGYTGQGRGRDDVVWLNNEYDFAHLVFVEYARTGERRFLDYAAVNALHWRDVDIAHVAADPRRRGGHIGHSARHVTGGVGASHQWVEGLIDAYHVLGDRDAYDAALGIGDNILRLMELPQYRDPGHSSTRDMGWALRAMLALYRETGDPKYVEPCRRIASFFQHWHAQLPGLLAPYTDHSMVRVNFMNSLTLVSLARYLEYFPDEKLKRMVLEEADDLLEHGRNRNGLFYYKELPSLKHQGATALPLQLLAQAYRLSGDRRYLEAGLAELEYGLLNLNMRFEIHTGAAEKFAQPGGGYSRVLFYPPGGKFMGTNLVPALEFLYAAKDTDLAEQIDFQLRLRSRNRSGPSVGLKADAAR